MLRSGLCAISFCAALAFALGCGGSEEPPDVSAADVGEEAEEAVEAASDYAAAQRRALEEHARRAADQIERELSDARHELAELEDDARARLATAIERAEHAREEVGHELDELQEAGAERWEDAGDRLSAALEEMEEARREVTAALAGDDSAGKS
jgi:DNA repair exonuclease SbcCD ATPase subunit